MKILSIVLSIIALGLIIFNFTQINFDNPFKGQSMIAIITIVASLCAILLMLILGVSKKIEQKVKDHK
ncbi:hypothetical protein [Algibacter lectus]|uniref:Uncharacterized protein n=1 Tax=Algibacter lectus TaxID=221126 RepID=A0A090VDE6_9FLAO|nr:hypothetical protein [Algibacter lectus]MWW24636.1 hypothetical protein [Algibacter lectus]TDY62656.1 hypothetical protein DFQ06_2503 [Algibacter lectus]GAL62791.1 hypothetical protein JCM19300_3359 [Algibacter lectus]SFC94831.1 hypothetical protein SAMN04489722_104125 [Algibacter lectus]